MSPFEITAVPTLSQRPETGPMQFGRDWPGVFIRGDNAFNYAAAIDDVLAACPENRDAVFSRMALEGLRDLLRSCLDGAGA